MIKEIDINRDEDGLILMKDNPELLRLLMEHMEKHDPELFKEMNEKMNEPVEGLTYEEEYEIGVNLYKNSSRELKQRTRLHKIKFTKWINSQMINKEDKFIVPTMLEPNTLGEKLYD